MLRSINGELFQAYVDQVLVLELRPGDIVVMDNLGSHRARASGSPSRPQRRASVTSALQPQLQPIENTFAKLKAALRTAAGRTLDGLWAAIGRIIAIFMTAECTNSFAAAGTMQTNRKPL